MSEGLIGIATFLALALASLTVMTVYPRLPERHRRDDTNTTVRLVAGLFGSMASLVLGLMVNSAAGTYQASDRNVHTFATEMIMFDRTMRAIGPQADDARHRLVAYLQHSLGEPSPGSAAESERLLTAVGTGLHAISLSDDQQIALWNDARQLYGQMVQQRWSLIEQYDGTLSQPLIYMLIAWLALIFAGLGYRAPNNAVVVTCFVAGALLLSVSVYLILDMDAPFSGPIQVSDQPLRRALAEIRV